MEAVKKIITPAFLAAQAKLKPGQVIVNRPSHPRQLNRVFAIPGYAERYLFINAQPHPKMFFCEKGKCALVLNGNAFLVQAGDLAFVDHHADHYVSFIKKNQPYRLLWFMPRGWGRIMMHQSSYDRNGIFRVEHQQWVKVPAEIYRTVDMALLLLRQEAFPREWDKLKAMVNNFFNALGTREVNCANGVTNSWQKRILWDIAEYLKVHCTQGLTLSELARHFSFSQNYLNALFRREYGESIMHNLNRRRLRWAAGCLKNTNSSISDIAVTCGYKDVYYFSRIFKKYFCLTPTEYRKNFC